jgi:hypothetical protein
MLLNEIVKYTKKNLIHEYRAINVGIVLCEIVHNNDIIIIIIIIITIIVVSSSSW